MAQVLDDADDDVRRGWKEAKAKQSMNIIPNGIFSKVCNEEKQVQFWSEMNVEGHPVGEGDLGLVIPIGIHGDGVPVVAPGSRQNLAEELGLHQLVFFGWCG